MNPSLQPSESAIRQRLIAGDFTISETVRDAVIEPLGADWLQILLDFAQRIGRYGTLEMDADGEKWVAHDRQSRLIFSLDGSLLVAAYSQETTSDDARSNLANGDFELSSATVELVTERLGDGGLEQARKRISEMAEAGTITWRTDVGGWRVAHNGDVALLDTRASRVQKFFWSVLSDTARGITVEQAKQCFMAAAPRVARRAAWRLERAWGPTWRHDFDALCRRIATEGSVAPHGDNAFEGRHGDDTVLLSIDGEVVVSARIALAGDADSVRAKLAAGTLQVHPAIDENNGRWRCPTSHLWRYFGLVVAAQGAVEPTSTHFRAQLAGFEMSISADGMCITGVAERSTDDPAEAAFRIQSGLAVPRADVAAQLPEAWREGVSPDVLTRTSGGWEYSVEGVTISLSGSAMLVAAVK